MLEGTNAPTAATAKIHAFGFTHWNATACLRPSGRETFVRPTVPLASTRNATESRYVEPTTLNPSSAAGTAWRRAPIPAATPTTSRPIPIAVPTTCGSVRRNPNAIPDAQSRVLFGPGDTEPTNAKPTRAMSSFTTGPDRIHVASSPFKAESLTGVLYDPCLLDEPREWVRAWKPAVPGIREVFHARFVDHAYPPHTHDSWTVFIVEEGAVRYDIETRHRGAAGEKVTILPPHVVHDGRAASRTGYLKRVLYVGTEVLDERVIGRAVDDPDIEDAALVGGLRALHRALRNPDETFAAEAMLALVSTRLLEHLGVPSDQAVERCDDSVSSDLRDLLDEHRFEPLTLEEAGRIVHASPAHLVRCFTRTFGIPPHRYLVGRRIDAARRRLLDGEPVAQVAVGVGFHDQAHLTRHFRRYVGTTPARYASPT